jgi:MFS family permease
MEQKIDWWGAITLVLAVVSLMFALELAGSEFAWDSIQILGLISVFVTCIIAFFIAEKFAKDPILPFWLFKKRLFATSQILAFLYGSTFIILTVFIPIFVQAIYGGSATNAGYILMPMMLGSVVGSGIGGIFQTKTSFRNLMIISVIAYFIGMLLLGTLTPDTSRILLTIYLVIVGFGVGFSFSLLPTASIHGLEPRYRGTASSTNSFLRSFGMTLGITIFGVIQNNIFTEKITTAFKEMQGTTGQSPFNLEDPQQIFQSGEREKIPGIILDKIVNAMSDSITTTFFIALFPIAIAAIVVLLMGNTRVMGVKQQSNNTE